MDRFPIRAQVVAPAAVAVDGRQRHPRPVRRAGDDLVARLA